MTQRAIAIFAKPPIAGKTKSRLAEETTPEFAAALSGAMLKDLTAEASAVESDVILFYPPGSSPDDFDSLLPLVPELLEQEGSDLGERMFNCFESLLERYDEVLLIGSDCISLDTEELEAAFDDLEEHDLVIQPADDGGYVLIGMSTAQQAPFEGVDWGSDQVMAQTRKQLTESELSWTERDPVFDVDTKADLSALKQFLAENSRPRVRKVLDSFSGTID